MSKRAEHEKKTITKSLKVSSDDLNIIDQKAKEKGMNFSRYMVESAIHGEKGLTPEILCKIENIIEKCMKVAGTKDSHYMSMIRMEVDELWAYLK